MARLQAAGGSILFFVVAPPRIRTDASFADRDEIHQFEHDGDPCEFSACRFDRLT